MNLLGDVLAAGGKSDDPHMLLGFSLTAIGIGLWFVVMGRQMLKEKPENRGIYFPRLSISWWERHPKLSIIGGWFWVVVGSFTLVFYLLWLLFGSGGPASQQ